MARTFEVPDDEDAQIWFKGYNLLTAKLIYTQRMLPKMTLADNGATKPCRKNEEMAEEGAKVFNLSRGITNGANGLFPRVEKEYLDDLGVESSGLDKLVALRFPMLSV